MSKIKRQGTQERQDSNESKGLKSLFTVMGVYPGW